MIGTTPETPATEAPDVGSGPDEGVRHAPASLVAHGVHLAYDRRRVVHGVDLAIPPGQVTVIVGANGCGKSTLLRSMARILTPVEGRVELDGTDLRRLRPRECARVLGLLPQQPVAPEGIAVADLVARGRHPHQGAFGRRNAGDDDAVARALTLTDTAELAGRRVEELSGGQRQRVWLAMMLAQDPRILLLDEPTTFLDIAHQVEILDLLAELNEQRGTTIAMVLHDLNLAARYAHHLVVMAKGRLVREGAPGDVLDAECVRDAFGMESRVVVDPVSGCPLVLPLGRHGVRAVSQVDAGVGDP